MNGFKSALLLSLLTTAISSGSASALTTTSESITCSSKNKLQAKIDAAPAGTSASFNISGNCNENITVPEGKTIILIGATANAKITAADILLPAVRSQGVTTIQNLFVSNATGSAETLVQTDDGGSINIVTSDLNAPNVGAVVAAWLGTITVTNSRVVGGTDDALEAWGGGSSLLVRGDPMTAVGPTGKFETYLKSAGSGIICAQGGVLNLRANVKGSANGSIRIDKSNTGLSANRCDFSLWNRTTSKSSIMISNNGVGIRANQSRGSLDQVTILNNAAEGISSASSDLEITSTDIKGNGSGLFAGQSRVAIGGALFENKTSDLNAGTMSSISFYAWRGTSSFPKALGWASSFNCWSGSRIDIDPDALVQDVSTAYDFLDCLYQN